MTTRTAGLFFLTSILVACGGPTGGNDAGTGGGTGGGIAAGGGSGGGSGGGTGGGSTGGGTGGGSASAKTGLISLYQYCLNVAVMDYCSGGAGALFGTTPAQVNSACTLSTLGGCQVVECVIPADAGTPPTTVVESAGTVAIAGTLVDGGISLAFGDGGYPAPTVMGRLWAGGETLTVSAAGATVPAFAGKTITAPHDLTLTAPACAAGVCGSLSRTADLTVSWTGAAATDVTATFTSSRSDKNVSLTCKLTSSPANIGSAALQKLGQNDAGFTNYFVVSPSAKSTFTNGAYEVTVSASGTSVAGTVITSN